MSDRYFVDTNILMYAHDVAAGSNMISPGSPWSGSYAIGPGS
jgi:hypothetical protein